MVFSKRARRDMIFLAFSGKVGFFFPKTWYFFLGQDVRDDLCQEIYGKTIFSVYMYGCYKRGVTPLCQKKKKTQRWSYPAKIHLKMIDVLDWHSKKSSSNSLYFHGDHYRSFHVLLSSKKPGNLIYRIEVWLLLLIIWLEIFCNKWSSTLCTIQSPGAVFGGVLERQ